MKKQSAANGFEAFGQKIKHAYEHMKQVSASPHSIAIGFAVGTFFCILPTPFLSVLIASIVAYFFKTINRISLVSSFVIWNPFVTIPMNIFGGTLGRILLMEKRSSYEHAGKGIMDVPELSFSKLSTHLVVGTFILSLVISVLCYCFIRVAVERYQARKKTIKP